MPAVYEKLGIRFQFPENWALDEKEALEGDNAVTVYSPGGAFWSVAVHPPSAEPAILVKAALEAMREEYRDLDAEPVRETVAGHQLVGCDLNFYCLDLTNTTLVRALRTARATLLVFCQADDREFEIAGPVFRAITESLLASQPPR